MKKNTLKGKSLKVVKGIEQPLYLNVNAIKTLKHKKTEEILTEEYVQGIISGDKILLSKAITIVESSLSEHQRIGQKIIEKILPYTGKSVRIGITGVPGVGKSTFIEALGNLLVKDKKKVTVLAIDPSSSRTKGSILGDKSRMYTLSTEGNAYIRPSPSSGTLGGVARKTRETILLCEAAGFDVILIETVGIGQSETAVHSMVDFFLILMLAGAGDELQGIKRGIIELADLLVINKSDDDVQDKIKLAIREYSNALHLYPAKPSTWIPKVSSCSSITTDGIQNVWHIIEEYFSLTKRNNFFEVKRQEQSKYWFYETVNSELSNSFYQDKEIAALLVKLEEDVVLNRRNPFNAAAEIMRIYNQKLRG